MNYKQIMMYAGVALLVIVLLSVAWHFLGSTRGGSQNAEIENFSGAEDASGNDYKLLFFFANWCPHCKAAKPEWEKTKAALDGKQVNGRPVKFVEYDCTEPSPELEAIMDKYNVSSYPTVLLVSPSGHVSPFENKPTKDALTNFLSSTVQ